MEYILASVQEAISRGKRCLVCCRGGIGRTATITAVLLMEIDGMDLEQALELLKRDGRMPQTIEQLNFVKRWEKKLRENLT